MFYSRHHVSLDNPPSPSQFSGKDNPQHFYSILLLVAIVHCFAIDTSACERGFSLMNVLKTARRSGMGQRLLRMLMVICSLGTEWKDPAKIPVASIVDIWRSESKKGRYEGELWNTQGARERPSPK